MKKLKVPLAILAVALTGGLTGVSPPAAHADGITNIVPPTISGTPAVGQTLTVDPGTWDPHGTVPYLYSWLKSPDFSKQGDLGFVSYGLKSGPDATAYTIQATDAGYQIRVAVSVYWNPAPGTYFYAFPYTNIVTIPPLAQVTVTFDGNGGLPASTVVSASQGGTVKLPAAPTRANFVFTGWNTKADGSGSVFTASTVVNADVTVFAQWTALSRLSGNNRVETAVKISQAGWGNGKGAWVVLASGNNFPDAMAGGPLAYALNGADHAPILLTTTNPKTAPNASLEKVVTDELGRLGTRNVIILGSPASVLAKIEKDLSDAGMVVERLGGASRYETATMIADRLWHPGPGNRAGGCVRGQAGPCVLDERHEFSGCVGGGAGGGP